MLLLKQYFSNFNYNIGLFKRTFKKPIRMSTTPKASKIIDTMLQTDYFSQWMQLERLAESEGYCQLRMEVRQEMLNGFGIVHGGILFSLADSALAFASNSQGRHAVSIESSISIFKSCREGELLFATAEELHASYRLAHYRVGITNQQEELVASFKGTVYRKGEAWEV